MRAKPPRKPKEFVNSMKRSLFLVCLLASGMGAAAFAQAGAGNPDPGSVPVTGATKIAIINFQQAVGATNEFQRDYADLLKKYQPRESALQQQNAEIETLKKQLQDAGEKLADADREARTRAIDEKTKNLQRAAEDLRNDEQSDGQETFQQVGQKVFDVMSTYAQKNGFSLVLDASQQNSGVFWASPGANITKAVVDAYNVKSGIPAPPPGVPSAPAPHAPASGARTPH